jgi:hypothetical protein
LNDFLKKWAEGKKEEFFSCISDEVLERYTSGKELDVKEYEEMRINSYERRLLFPLFSDKLLLKDMKYAMNQAGYGEIWKFSVPQHYNDAIENLYLPELIRRFETKLGVDND